MYKKFKRLLITGFILSLSAALMAGCGSKPSTEQGQAQSSSGSITAVGSTAMLPFIEEASQQFMGVNPNIQISVQGGGSGTGLSQVFSGAVAIGNSDIFAEEKEGVDVSKLTDTKICVVGVTPVVNPGVTIDNLTKKQLIDVFTGKITNWKEVGGSDQKIVLINRAKGSGTRTTFKAYALDGNEETAGGMEIDSSGQAKKTISDTPGAISYVALPYVDNTIKVIKIDNIEPNEENIISGKYPVWSYEHMYTLGEPTGAKKAFIDYMLTSDAQNIVAKLGFIQIAKMKFERDAKGKITEKITENQ